MTRLDGENMEKTQNKKKAGAETGGVQGEDRVGGRQDLEGARKPR